MAIGNAWNESKSAEGTGFTNTAEADPLAALDAHISGNNTTTQAADPLAALDSHIKQSGLEPGGVPNVTLNPVTTPSPQMERGMAPVDNGIVDLGGKIKGTYNSATALRKAVQDYEKLTGVKVPVISGYRSNEEQASLYNKLHGISPVAPPGASHHNHGSAYDIGLSGKELNNFLSHAAKYGFAQSVMNDENHITYQPEIPATSSERKWADDDPRMLGAQGKQAKIGSPQQLLQGMAKSRGYTNEDASIMNNQIHAESAFNPQARSSAGAIGAPQFMPGTLAPYLDKRGISVADYLHNPGTQYDIYFEHVTGLLKSYNGNWARALAAYNAGPGAEDHFQNVAKRITMPETRDYVAKILGVSPQEADAMVVNGTGPNFSSTTPTAAMIQKNQSTFKAAAQRAAIGLDLGVASPELDDSFDPGGMGQKLHPDMSKPQVIAQDIKEMGKMALSGMLSGVAGINEWFGSEDRNLGETVLKGLMQNPMLGPTQRLFTTKTQREAVREATKATWGKLAEAAAPSDWFKPEFGFINSFRHGEDFNGWALNNLNKTFNVFSPAFSPIDGVTGLADPKAWDANVMSLAMSLPYLAGAWGTMHAMSPALMTKNAAGAVIPSKLGNTLGAPGEFAFKRMIQSPMFQGFASHLGEEWMKQMSMTTAVGASQMMAQAVGDTLHAGGGIQEAAINGLMASFLGSMFGMLTHIGTPLKASADAYKLGMRRPGDAPGAPGIPATPPPPGTPPGPPGPVQGPQQPSSGLLSPYLAGGREIMKDPGSSFRLALEPSMSDIVKEFDNATGGYFSQNIVRSAQTMYRQQMDIARMQATERLVNSFNGQADHIDQATTTAMQWVQQGLQSKTIQEKLVASSAAQLKAQQDALQALFPLEMGSPEAAEAIAMAKEAFTAARNNDLVKAAALSKKAGGVAKKAGIPFENSKTGGPCVRDLARMSDELEVEAGKLAQINQALPPGTQEEAQELGVVFSHVAQSLRRKAMAIGQSPETTAIAGGPLSDPSQVATLDQFNAVVDKALQDYAGIATPFPTQLEQEVGKTLSTMLEYSSYKDSPQGAIASITSKIQEQMQQLIDNKPVRPEKPQGGSIEPGSKAHVNYKEKMRLYVKSMEQYETQLADYQKQLRGPKMQEFQKQLDVLNNFNSKRINQTGIARRGLENRASAPIEQVVDSKLRKLGVAGNSGLIDLYSAPRVSADAVNTAYVEYEPDIKIPLNKATRDYIKAGKAEPGENYYTSKEKVKNQIITDRPVETHGKVKADLDYAYDNNLGYVNVKVPISWIKKPGPSSPEKIAGKILGEKVNTAPPQVTSKGTKIQSKVGTTFLKRPMMLGNDTPQAAGDLAGWAAEVVKRSETLAKNGGHWNPNINPKEAVLLPDGRYVQRASFEANPGKFQAAVNDPFHDPMGIGFEQEPSGKRFGFPDPNAAPVSELSVLDGKIRYEHYVSKGATEVPAYVRQDVWDDMLKHKFGEPAVPGDPTSPSIHDLAQKAVQAGDPTASNVVGDFALASGREYLKQMSPEAHKQMLMDQLEEMTNTMKDALAPSEAISRVMSKGSYSSVGSDSPTYKYPAALQMLLNQSTTMQAAMDKWINYNSGGIGLADRMSRTWSALGDWHHIQESGAMMAGHIADQLRSDLEKSISTIAPALKFRKGQGWAELMKTPSGGREFGERFIDAVESMHSDQTQMQDFLRDHPEMREILGPYFGLSAVQEKFQVAHPDMKGIFNLINTRHRFPWLSEINAYSADSGGASVQHRLVSENARKIPTLAEARKVSAAAEAAVRNGDWKTSEPTTPESRYRWFVKASQGDRMRILRTTDGKVVNDTLANLALRNPVTDPVEMIHGQIKAVLEASSVRNLINQMMHSPVPDGGLVAGGSRPINIIERFKSRETPITHPETGLPMHDPVTKEPLTRRETETPPIVRSLYTGVKQTEMGPGGVKKGDLSAPYKPFTGEEFGLSRHDTMHIGGEDVPVGELHAHPDFAYLLNNFFTQGKIDPNVMQHLNNLTRTGQLFLGSADHLLNVWSSHYYQTMGYAAQHIDNAVKGTPGMSRLENLKAAGKQAVAAPGAMAQYMSAGRELAKDPAYAISSVQHGLNLHAMSSGIYGLAREVKRIYQNTGLNTRPEVGKGYGPWNQKDVASAAANIAQGLREHPSEAYEQMKDNWDEQRGAQRLGVAVKDLAKLGTTAFKAMEHFVCFQPIQDAMVAAHWHTTHRLWNEMAEGLLKKGFPQEQVFKAIHTTSANLVNRNSGALNSYELPHTWRETAFRSIMGQLILSPNWEASSMRTFSNHIMPAADPNPPRPTNISDVIANFTDKVPLVPGAAPHGQPENMINSSPLTPFMDYQRGIREHPELADWVRKNASSGIKLGLASLFCGANLINFVNGHGWTWNNSPGDASSLFKWMAGDHLIGMPLGQMTRFITILGHGASLPDLMRGLYDQTGAMPKAFVDVARNQDYAGRPITSPDPAINPHNVIGRSMDAAKYMASKAIPWEELMGNPHKTESALAEVSHILGGVRMSNPKSEASMGARYKGVQDYMNNYMDASIAVPLQRYHKAIAEGKQEEATRFMEQARKIATEDGIRPPAWSAISEEIAGGDTYRLSPEQFERQVEKARLRAVGLEEEKIERATGMVPENAKKGLETRLKIMNRPHR